MIKVITEKIISTSTLEEYVPKVKPLLEESRKEIGNIMYEVKLCNMGYGFVKVRFFEIWKNEKAFEDHLITKHVLDSNNSLEKFHLKDLEKEHCFIDDEMEDWEIRYIDGWATLDFSDVDYMGKLKEVIAVSVF